MLLTLVWTLACLAGIDAAINVAFRYPADPKQQAGSLPTYFEYGRSIEGKLRRMVGPTDAKSDGLVTAGWPDRVSSAVASPPPGKLGVAVYGMSFSNQIARAMQELDPSVAPTMYAGPSAPPNHSYACFVAQNDGGRERNPVQVFAVLASSVKGLLTLGGSTTTFEKPAPFTFPRYTLGANGSLTEIRPIVATVEDLRAAVADDAKWTAHIEQLA
ncbi:MAG TPA: hypothetical protein VK324_16010, partial [Tepidisphaeraceae bacterium]|nr:hypothetical protein [Tepidisphaeraceae bacterium]